MHQCTAVAAVTLPYAYASGAARARRQRLAIRRTMVITCAATRHVERRAVLASATLLLGCRLAAVGPAGATAAQGWTVERAKQVLSQETMQLGQLSPDVSRILSCLAVDTPPNCLTWRALSSRLRSAADASHRMVEVLPVVGASIAEPIRRQPERASFLQRLESAVTWGSQINPADIERMEAVEELTTRAVDAAALVERLLQRTAASFAEFQEQGNELVAEIDSTVRAVELLLTAA